MKIYISKIVGNETIYVKAFGYTGGRKKYTISFTPKKDSAHDFKSKETAKKYCQVFNENNTGIFEIETELPAKFMDSCSIRKGEALILALIAALMFASCSPKIQQYQVTKVNGQKFQVTGHKGTFISKDSIHIGQWVPVKF